MKRRKKKINAQQTKQEQGARLNTFKKRIFHYLKLMDCEEVGGLINKISLQAMYNLRMATLPKLKFAEGVSIDNKLKQQIRSDFDNMISENIMEIYPDGQKTNAKEVLGYLTVIYYLVKMKEKSRDFNELKAIKQFEDNAPDLESLSEQADKAIDKAMSYAVLFHSCHNERIYWMVNKPKKVGNFIRKFDIEVKESVPDSISVVIDQHPRRVFRLCYAFANYCPMKVSISSDILNLSQSMANVPIPVYVQNHVLHRLAERLDCVPRYLREFYLYHNMSTPVFIHFKGQLLAEFHIDEYGKVGYLIVDYVEGILLIKTFLLMSSSGTPEGQMLDELSGMQKIDHTYWAIDRLSTFQNSDMKDNKEIKEIFEKAGCGVLFKEVSLFKDEDEIHIKQAMKMAKYIEWKKEKEELVFES